MRISTYLRSLCLLSCFVAVGISQSPAEPTLLGTWTPDHEDFGEFIYHRLERVKFDYLESDPNGAIVGRICSKRGFPGAFIDSWGVAYRLPKYAADLKIPSDKVFFATSSECGARREEYWFVPAKATLRSDEKISADQVDIKRWINSSHEPTAKEGEAELTAQTGAFIKALLDDPRAQGFLIQNSGMRPSRLRTAIKQIHRAGISRNRFQIVRKKVYTSYYPEFMVFTIRERAKQTEELSWIVARRCLSRQKELFRPAK